MTAPFSSEDFVRRSLFSSLFSSKLRVRTPRYGSSNDEPGTSSQTSGFASAPSQPLSCYPSAVERPVDHASPTTADSGFLCTQLEHNLYLASPQPQEPSVCSPESIYEQIVHECSELEQKSNQTSQPPSIDQITPSIHELGVHSSRQPFCDPALQQILQPAQPYPVPPTLCVGCQNQHAPTSPIPFYGHIPEPRGVSVEEIVKMVLAAVKDIPHANSPADSESPEEILRRKRQQNNEAASRYRRRQKEARLHAEKELDEAMQRNETLRAEIAQLQSQIDALRRTVTANGLNLSTPP